MTDTALVNVDTRRFERIHRHTPRGHTVWYFELHARTWAGQTEIKLFVADAAYEIALDDAILYARRDMHAHRVTVQVLP